jgi:copper(I)-binding protein
MTVPLALLAFAVVACGGDGGVEVVDAWARPSPEVADSAAFYISLANNAEEEDAVVGVSADRCGSMQVHETVMVDDVMEMQHVDELALPPGETVVMEPGGFHLMCMMVSEPLVEGDAVDVDITLRSGSTMTVPVDVEDR